MSGAAWVGSRWLLAGFALACVFDPPARLSQESRLGALTGRVTLSDTGAPAPDVWVFCTARDRSTEQRVAPDEDGRFVCRLMPGVYGVRVQVSGSDTRYLSAVYGATGPADEPRWLRVSRRAVPLEIALARSGSIAGRLLDPNGKPVKQAVVHATTPFHDAELPLPGAHASSVATDADGRFALTGLSPGAYRIQAIPADRMTTADKDGRRNVPTYYPGVADVRRALAVQVGAGDEVGGLEMTLARSIPASLRGRVLGNDGAVVAGATVALVESQASQSSTIVSAHADEDGVFRLSGVPSGSYQLVASAQSESSSFQHAVEAVVVGETDIADLTLTVRSGGFLRGRLIADTGGRLERPVRIGTVAPIPDRYRPPAADVRLREGAFQIGPVFGHQLVRVSDLPPGWWLKSVSVGARGITNVPIDMTDGLEGVDVVVSLRLGGISGQVSHEAGELSPDVAVLLFAADPTQWVSSSTVLRRVWPDEEGHFVAEGLPAGAYRVVAVPRTPRGFLQGAVDVIAALGDRAASCVVRDGEVTPDVRVVVVPPPDR